MNVALFLIALIVLLVSAYTDMQNGKVLNEVVLPAIGISLILQLFNLTFLDYLFRVILIIAIFFFYSGYIGGGDAKLLMMLSIAQGPYKTLAALGIGSLIVVGISLAKDPKGYFESIKSQLVAFLTRTTGNLKNTGETIRFVPLLLIGFIISTVVFGI